MKKLFALALAVLMIASVFCACGKKTVDCQACGETKEGKAYKIETFGIKMTVCKDCKEEYDEAMEQLGDLDLGDLLGDVDTDDLGDLGDLGDLDLSGLLG